MYNRDDALVKIFRKVEPKNYNLTKDDLEPFFFPFFLQNFPIHYPKQSMDQAIVILDEINNSKFFLNLKIKVLS